MKKLSKEASFNLRNGFGSLVSNRAAIECGRSFPWWIAIIIGLIGAFLPIIPIMTNIANTNGDSYISGDYVYSYDRNAAISLVEMTKNKDEFRLDEEHVLHYYHDGEESTSTAPVVITEYINPISSQYDFKVIWLIGNNNKSVSDYYNEYVGKQYITGTTTEKSDKDKDKTYYTPSYLFFSKDSLALYLVKNNTTTAASKFSGNFVNVPVGELVSRLATVQGLEIPTTIEDISRAYMEGVLANTKSLFNDAYSDIKQKSLLYTTLIYYGVYVGLVLFLGLLIFLLTRGKRNINNYLKWYQCMAISGWAAFTPGLLAMILGFILARYAIMFFILLFGIRIMWLTMKQLSPTYEGQGSNLSK